ncbi:hypothetical protein CVT25_013336 [Psilocybe cyanescens]|uniref:Uncharacterized protein n=1 Tax=Psilocybe cyanescens TaxID=93625 RepID=A0A409W9Q4_PSICY|nr:hypothetical protein CVT25_013336 [Psilocybe cyanescens]
MHDILEDHHGYDHEGVGQNRHKDPRILSRPAHTTCKTGKDEDVVADLVVTGGAVDGKGSIVV